jgi:hypothetical protein
MTAMNPDLTAKRIIQAGAIGLKDLVTESLFPKVTVAYAESLRLVFIVAAALAVAGAIIALPIPWKSVKKVQGGSVNTKENVA